MALRRQSLSPTANLLRNSRLFAIPNPLPRPNVGEVYGAGVTKASETATLPYPTHQAIATTKSSLARGDWGLKRPLPARSRLVQVSDPVLRVTQLDTIEHVTDFDSASDHVRTRQKWEEMGVPMMKGMSEMREFNGSGAPPAGAFEVRDDTTSYDSDKGLDEAGLYLQALKESAKKNHKSKQFSPFTPPPMEFEAHNAKRWKHDGPWLPGMNAEDFTDYISKEISKRRTEFNTYLQEFVKNEIYTTRQLAASTDSENPPPLDAGEAEEWQKERSKQWATITRREVQAGIRSLRREAANNPLQSKLFNKLIAPFLRLPTIRMKFTQFSAGNRARDIETYQFDQDSAPLSTHPSAGLGYLRTRSYIQNHPVLGPQAAPAPIEARVVQPRTTARLKETYAKFGVAGFVANDEFRNTRTSSAINKASDFGKDVETIDLDTPGGKKVFVQPQFGSVANDGRIHVKVLRSTGAEAQVKKGALDDLPPMRQNAEEDPLKDLESMVGSGGAARDMGEGSRSARQFSNFMEGMRPEREGRGTPGRGFPGVADALR
ncbi:mitochondrial ribosomal protein MRP51 [Phaeosphaeria sp. MPI-PUGE-AT-0046c]|nr:mitochondrial ribosomal protein MRP51 [Phaeosphaeria sp. MPI-PUGE-AT-0046c]